MFFTMSNESAVKFAKRAIVLWQMGMTPPSVTRGYADMYFWK